MVCQLNLGDITIEANTDALLFIHATTPEHGGSRIKQIKYGEGVRLAAALAAAISEDPALAGILQAAVDVGKLNLLKKVNHEG